MMNIDSLCVLRNIINDIALSTAIWSHPEFSGFHLILLALSEALRISFLCR